MDTVDKLKLRLAKANIPAADMADLLWPYLEKRIAKKLLTTTMRQNLMIAIMQGLAVRWPFGDSDCTSPQRLAEQAERLVNAAMRVTEL